MYVRSKTNANNFGDYLGIAAGGKCRGQFFHHHSHSHSQAQTGPGAHYCKNRVFVQSSAVLPSSTVHWIFGMNLFQGGYVLSRMNTEQLFLPVVSSLCDLFHMTQPNLLFKLSMNLTSWPNSRVKFSAKM